MVNRVIPKENVCILFPIFSNASNAGLPGLTKKIMVKEVRERENGKQVPKRIFSLNRFSSHRATKTSGIWKLFYSNLFSSKICLISNASDSPHNYC